MKTNFKTLALQAGIGAALAAGSMSASAVITAVPAPAQLIPLFYYSNDITTSALNVDTAVRVIVPQSVGTDTVIGIMRGDSNLTAQANWNSSQQFGTTPTAANTLHYWVMDINSREIFNSALPVTLDDELYFYASTLPGFTANVVSGAPTYLLLTTQAAVNGGNPDYMFTAEAWLENTSNFATAGSASGIATAVNIPVLGLADAADSTNAPTPGNNVIEAYLGIPGAAGPIASPVHTGIRTGGTANGANFRVVDVPVHGSVAGAETESTTIVAWTDANNRYTNIGLYAVDRAEIETSRGTTSLPNQLNFLNVGYANTSNSIAAGRIGPVGIADNYTTNLGNTGLANGGFFKMVVPAVAPPADWVEPGAYSSMVVFTIPATFGSGTAQYDAAAPTTDGSEIALDTGWFVGQ